MTITQKQKMEELRKDIFHWLKAINGNDKLVKGINYDIDKKIVSGVILLSVYSNGLEKNYEIGKKGKIVMR